MKLEGICNILYNILLQGYNIIQRQLNNNKSHKLLLFFLLETFIKNLINTLLLNNILINTYYNS